MKRFLERTLGQDPHVNWELLVVQVTHAALASRGQWGWFIHAGGRSCELHLICQTHTQESSALKADLVKT